MGDTLLIISGLAWIALNVIAADASHNKGNSWIVTFLFGFFLSPLVALAYAGFSEVKHDVLDERLVRLGKAKICPACAERVKLKALVCRYCGKSLN